MSQPSLKKTQENNVVGTIITEVTAIKHYSSATSLLCPGYWWTGRCSAGDTDGVATLHSNVATLHQERECARLIGCS